MEKVIIHNYENVVSALVASLNFSKLYLTSVTKLVAILEGHIQDYVKLRKKRHGIAKQWTTIRYSYI